MSSATKYPQKEDWPEPQIDHLRPYLEQLPPMISRKKAAWFTGGAVSSKTLANADQRGVGPRVRQTINEGVAYPTAYLLEYLEKKGVSTIVVPSL